MEKTLRPCPFCGSRAVDLRATCYGGGERGNKPRVAFYVRCRACGARGPMFKARGEGFGPISERDHDRQRARALDAWNLRAERTCRAVMPPCEPGVEEIPVCSECGKQLLLDDDECYCPRCGARVVDE